MVYGHALSPILAQRDGGGDGLNFNYAKVFDDPLAKLRRSPMTFHLQVGSTKNNDRTLFGQSC